MSTAQDLDYSPEEERVIELLQDRARLMEQHGILGFVPNPGQWEWIEKDQVKRKGSVGSNQRGKALRNGTPIATPDGWRPIETLKRGDLVIGSTGAPTRVLGVYPQGRQPTYRLRFDDGAWTDASGDHLWTFQSPRARFNKKSATYHHWTTATTEFLLDTYGKRPPALKRPAIPPCPDIQFTSRPLPLHPYVVGVLLGDGCLSSGNFNVSSIDEDLLARFQNLLPEGHRLSPKEGCDYRIVYTPHGKRNPALSAARKIGIVGAKAHDKKIPDDYLHADPESRLELLRGLMDTDGTVDGKANKVVFNSVSLDLATGVMDLCRSLGGKSTRRGRKVGYEVRVWMPRHNPFWLPRKAQKVRPAQKTENRILHEITPIGNHECTCISVDDPAGLFVSEFGVVTHNTTIIVVDAYSHSIGCRPFLPPDHPNFRVLMPNGDPIPVPNKGQMCAEDFPVGITENLWPTWQEWIPKPCYVEAKLERGIPRIIKVDVSAYPWADQSDPLYPYSYIYMHAYQQGREAFQGVRCHWVLDDEPPPRAIFQEQMRGLIRHGGKWMGAMTCVEDKHIWIYDLFMPPRLKRGEKADTDAFRDKNFCLIAGSIYDNLKKPDGSGALTMEDIEHFKQDLGEDEEQIAVRIEGKPLHLTNTFYGDLWDERTHVVEHREPDPNNCHVLLCDAHPTKAYALLWMEVNEHNQWYAYRELYDEKLSTVRMIADAIKEIEGWKRNQNGAWAIGNAEIQVSMRLIDPIADAVNKRGEQGISDIQDFAMNHDLYWVKWSRAESKAHRAREVRDWLMPGTGPRAEPVLTVSENCTRLIYEVPRYREKKPDNVDTTPRSGVMLDVDADMMQCVISAKNSGLTYDILDEMRHPMRRDRKVYGRGYVRPSAGYGLDHERATPMDPEEDLGDWWNRGRMRA